MYFHIFILKTAHFPGFSDSVQTLSKVHSPAKNRVNFITECLQPELKPIFLGLSLGLSFKKHPNVPREILYINLYNLLPCLPGGVSA